MKGSALEIQGSVCLQYIVARRIRFHVMPVLSLPGRMPMRAPAHAAWCLQPDSTCCTNECLASNKRMQQLAEKFNIDVIFNSDSAVAKIEQDRATPLSLLQEVMFDSCKWATAALDMQSRSLRPTAELSSQAAILAAASP